MGIKKETTLQKAASEAEVKKKEEELATEATKTVKEAADKAAKESTDEIKKAVSDEMEKAGSGQSKISTLLDAATGPVKALVDAIKEYYDGSKKTAENIAATGAAAPAVPTRK